MTFLLAPFRRPSSPQSGNTHTHKKGKVRLCSPDRKGKTIIVTPFSSRDQPRWKKSRQSLLFICRVCVCVCTRLPGWQKKRSQGRGEVMFQPETVPTMSFMGSYWKMRKGGGPGFSITRCVLWNDKLSQFFSQGNFLIGMWWSVKPGKGGKSILFSTSRCA